MIKLHFLFRYMNRLKWALLLIVGLPMYTSGQTLTEKNRYEYSHQSMGTLFRIVCYAENKSLSDRLSKEAFKRIDTLNYIMSDYLPGSELNHLCRQSGSGQFIEVSPELFNIIQLSYNWSTATAGIFDITIGPLTRLWRRAGRLETLPTREQLNLAMEHTGYINIRLDSSHKAVLLMKPNMQLDLGGIAKGFAVDEVYRIFNNSGISCLLVDGGGDIRTGIPPPGSKGWKIVLENFQEPPKVLYVSNEAIATSGDLYRSVVIDSVKYSHIIDPRTGYGLTHLKSVTIQAKNCTDADVLASVVSIMGPRDGRRFLRKYPDTKAIIIQEEKGKVKQYKKGRLRFVR